MFGDTASLGEYLKPTLLIDWDHPAVAAFVENLAVENMPPRDQAIRLFYAVRDGIRYDGHSACLTEKGLCASNTLRLGRGFCVAKAIVLTACLRAVGIPTKIGFADVRNHLATERMRRGVKGDTYYWHGYAVLLLEGNWIKATPAFDIGFCNRFRVKPLEFDGYSDALFHPYDLDGKKHMEYVRFHGEFSDVPLDRIRETYLKEYGFTSPDAVEG